MDIIANNQNEQNDANSENLSLNKIVLVGNPNVGKSVFFNKFTNTYVEVSNYPGTTVDLSIATINNIDIIDTPGVYGIGANNDEEIVTKDILLQADVIINVVSALSLDRDLFLTQQLIDMGCPMVIALNQLDEAKSRGIIINTEELENLLGVKVFSTIAIKNQGIQEVKDYVLTKKIEKPDFQADYLDELFAEEESCRADKAKCLLEVDENQEKIALRDKIYTQRRKRVNNIIQLAVSETKQGLNISTRIGNALLNPIFGAIAAVSILLLLYQTIGVLVAGEIVDFLENTVFAEYYSPLITDFINKIVSYAPLKQILIGEFGLLTMTVQYILAVLLPLIFSFSIFMAFLEDSGYLPRLAVLTDRFLTKLGLNGRAVIPIILGLGCTTMAMISTRILGSKRERTIATSLLGLVVPCSAQLAVIIGLMAVIGGLKSWIIYVVTIFIVLVIAGTVLNKLLPGKSSSLLIDLPPMRFPQIKNVLKKSISKSKHFLEEATPLFFLGAFLITILEMSGGLSLIQKAFAPITVNILNLPAQTATVFIMGLIRRDFGAAGLAEMAGLENGAMVLTHAQILVALIVLTLFVPCIASVIVMYKERGFKEASLIWLGTWVTAFATGGILSRILWMVM